MPVSAAIRARISSSSLLETASSADRSRACAASVPWRPSRPVPDSRTRSSSAKREIASRARSSSAPPSPTVFASASHMPGLESGGSSKRHATTVAAYGRRNTLRNGTRPLVARRKIDCPRGLIYASPDMRSGCGAWLVAMLALAACGKGPPEATAPAEQGASSKLTADATSGEVVARYQGRQLTADEVRKEMERLPAPSRAYVTAPERKRQFVENLILNDLLFDEGKKAGYDRDPEIERQVNDLRKRLVVQRVMRQYQTPPEVTDDQARAYYDENPTLYSTTQIHASHILVKDEDTAKQILAELKEHPEKFADIAKEKSTDTGSAQKGGDLRHHPPLAECAEVSALLGASRIGRYGKRPEGRRPRHIRPGADGAGVRARCLRLAARAAERRGQDPVRLPHHHGQRAEGRRAQAVRLGEGADQGDAPQQAAPGPDAGPLRRAQARCRFDARRGRSRTHHAARRRAAGAGWRALGLTPIH